MTYADEIVTLLKNDAALSLLLTGGVYNYPKAGRKGMTRIQIPGAYDPDRGFMKPSVIVLQLDGTPTHEAVNPTTGYMTTVTPVLVWIYDDGDAGYATIKQAHDRIYTLLIFQQIAGAFQVLWKRTIMDKREPDLKDACYWRMDIDVHGYIGS